MSSAPSHSSLGRPGRGLVWISQAGAQMIRRVWLRFSGVELGRGCTIDSRVEAALGRSEARSGHITFADYVRISTGVILHPYGGKITLGHDVYLGPYCVIYGHGGVEIGPDTLISMHCRILSSEHTIPPAGVAVRSQPDVLKPTRIGQDVWLGAGVTVLGGVTIGDGCIVGAGAVVSRDLPANSVALGLPARVVRRRS